MYADIQMINSVFAANIDASAKIVLFAIIYHANKETHEAFPSWRTLMDEFESGGVVASRYPRTGQEHKRSAAVFETFNEFPAAFVDRIHSRKHDDAVLFGKFRFADEIVGEPRVVRNARRREKSQLFREHHLFVVVVVACGRIAQKAALLVDDYRCGRTPGRGNTKYTKHTKIKYPISL